jgi:protein SCO1
MKELVIAAVAVALAGVGTVLALLFAAPDSSNSGISGPSARPYRGSRPPAGIKAPDFTLRDYRGQTVRMAGLRGRIVLTTFVDSACHESCPIILARLARGLRLLDQHTRSQVTALAITVNPPVDTASHVRRFLRQRGALGQIDYLIGRTRQLRPVWKAYGILPAVDTGNADIHSADVRIFDRHGEWVSTLHTAVDLTPANVAHDVRTALERSS